MTLTVTLIRSEVQEADSPPVLSQKHTERGEGKERQRPRQRRKERYAMGYNKEKLRTKGGRRKEINMTPS